MKRRMSAFLVAMALLAAQLLAGVPRAMAAEAGGELILKVHYHREDANYENWTVWLWELGGGDAIDAPLVEEDGEMVATMTVGFGGNPVLTYVVTLFPVASMFCAPVRYLVGDIGIGMLTVSWVIQIAVILLLAYVCARIYRALMMYRGSRMKLGGWITMFRQSSTKEVDHR